MKTSIALLPLSAKLHREHFARFAGLKRCVLEHDPRSIRPVSYHARPLQVKAAQKVAARFRQNAAHDVEMLKIVTAVNHSCEVLQRLTAVMHAAEAVIASAKPVEGSTVQVDAALLETMAGLIAQAGNLAAARTDDLAELR